MDYYCVSLPCDLAEVIYLIDHFLSTCIDKIVGINPKPTSPQQCISNIEKALLGLWNCGIPVTVCG